MERVMVVDNEAGILSVLSTLLRAEGYEVVPMRDSGKALSLVQSDERFDLLIFDIRMVPIDGMQLLRASREKRPSSPVIILTAYATVETAIEALRLGAFDYIRKPFEVDEILITIRRALDYSRTLAENEDLKAQLVGRGQFENIVAESKAMKNICQMVERVAPTDASVLIFGESGTGKELVARAIHAHSRRKDKRFVAVNCAALPEPLLESEMFGHVKGAFTGAMVNKEGLFEVADGGTIFLDEISGMTLNTQSKLLRVLQEKELRRVGANDDIKVDVRVIAATNVRPEVMMANKTFREDLFYRISVIPIEIKPLRERPEDILPIVFHVLRRELPPGTEIPTIDAEVSDILTRCPWPGNVRELENAIKYALAFAKEGRITRETLPLKILSEASTVPARIGMAPDGSFQIKTLRAFLRERERDYVAQALAHFEGDKSKTAAALQISLASLYRKIPETD
ncbi:MAG: sigma-54 dependent transcriptional regulator [bacterium]